MEKKKRVIKKELKNINTRHHVGRERRQKEGEREKVPLTE